MATSGTYNFLMNRDQLIAAALRTLEVIGAGETPSPADLTNCAEALNIMVKAMVLDGMPLWCIQQIPVSLLAGFTSYLVGPLSGLIRPVRILQAYVSTPGQGDREVEIVSIFDWERNAQKFKKSNVVQICYKPQLDNGTILVYNAPSDDLSTLQVIIQRQIQDINLATQNPDFPQEAYQMLKWCLADELSLEYGAKPMKIQVCAAKAKAYREAFMSFEQEPASAYFLPSGRRN